MISSGIRSPRSAFLRRLQSLACAGLVLAPPTPAMRLATAECGCGVAPAPVAVPTQTYRLDYQTVYDERQVSAERVSYETVYDTKTYAVQKPVW